MAEEVADRCRICLDHVATASNPLLSPCACRGSQLYVHELCLKRWMINSRSARCQVCRTPYHIHIPPISTSTFLRRLVTSFWDRMSRHGSIFCHDPDEVIWAGRSADMSGPRFRLLKAFSWLAIFHYMIIAVFAMLLVKNLGMGLPFCMSFTLLFTAARLLIMLPINSYRSVRWVFWCTVCAGLVITCTEYGIQVAADQSHSSAAEVENETWNAVAWEVAHMLYASLLSWLPLACQVFGMHTYLAFQNLGSDAYIVLPARLW